MAVAVVVALRLLRRGSLAFGVLAGVAAVVVVAWSMTTQVYAAEGERILSKQVAQNLPKPYDWVEQATGGGSVVVLGQQISDPTNIWLTEFFNPSVRKMWSLDGTAIRVGAPILTPDLDATDGTLTPLARHRLRACGERRRASGARRRAAAERRPLSARRKAASSSRRRWSAASRTGGSSAPGGEKTARASYTRYDVSNDGPGFAVVKLSRVGWCPKPSRRGTGTATVRIGPVGIGPDKQPAIARVTDTTKFLVPDCKANGVLLTRPAFPGASRSSSRRRSPRTHIDPDNSDRRELGGVLDVRFQPLFGG